VKDGWDKKMNQLFFYAKPVCKRFPLPFLPSLRSPSALPPWSPVASGERPPPCSFWEARELRARGRGLFRLTRVFCLLGSGTHTNACIDLRVDSAPSDREDFREGKSFALSLARESIRAGGGGGLLEEDGVSSDCFRG
jgi:hypothetical protein